MSLLSELHALAKAVHNRYIFGSAGPNGYDCSGGVYVALRKLDPAGMKNVRRFYTWNLVSALASKTCGGVIRAVPAGDRRAGDIVLWDGGTREGHVGVMVNGGDLYDSFYNTREGFKRWYVSRTLAAIRPRYYRYTPSHKPAPKPTPAPKPKPVPPTPQGGGEPPTSVFYDHPTKVGKAAKPLPLKGANLPTFVTGAGDYTITATALIGKVSSGVTLRITYQDFDSKGKAVGPVHGLGAHTAATTGYLQVSASKTVGAPKKGMQRRFRVYAWAGVSATVNSITVNWIK